MAQFIVNSLMLGGIYALIASGFSLVYGVMNILNIAHGAFIMLGAFITYSAVTMLGLSEVPAIVIATMVLFVFGYLLHRYVLFVLGGLSIFLILIFTFGLDMALQNIGVLFWDPIYRSLDSQYAGSILVVGDAYIPVLRIALTMVAWTVAGILFVFLKKTRMGLSIEACALDVEAAVLAGVDTRKVFAVTFALGAGLGGIAGGLLAFVKPIHPYMGLHLLGFAFAASVLGGLGNVSGAAVAAGMLAFVEVGTTTLLGAGYGQAVPYLMVVLVLVFLPRGLFGRRYFAEVKV